MKVIKRYKVSMLIAAILSINVGVAMLIRPSISSSALLTILCIALLAGGAANVALCFLRKSWYLRAMDISYGLAQILYATILNRFPSLFTLSAGLCFGVFVLIHGLIDLWEAVDLKEAGLPLWRSAFVLALITLAFACALMVAPFASSKLLVMLIGSVLIYDGASDILMFYWITKNSA